MNEAREVRLRTLANKLKYFGPRTPYPTVMGNGAKAIKELIAEVKQLEGELAQARAQQQGEKEAA